ncbi:MAG TPA: ABC transporter ATP-binding protein [Candidatus Paceibacterota bacterium]|nr:ABC transporter ATP-binding protein [Candidatus Paceibacterota bacterium]
MSADATTAFALSRVSARFDDERDKSVLALRDITLSAAKGSFVSLSGPSGAGKSTLLRVLLGFMRARGGHIVRNFSRPGMVFQNYALFPWATALENVAFGLKMSGVERAARLKKAREKLAEVGLAHLEHHYPAELSGGQKQRVGLARALAIEPDLLILDEPFSNLDTITAEDLKHDLLKLWRQYGMTILMVNHLIPDSVELSDEVVLMSAHPGEVKKTITIELPRPRDPRAPDFYRYVDLLTEELKKLG